MAPKRGKAKTKKRKRQEEEADENPQVETPVDCTAGVGESEDEDSDDAPLSEVSKQSSKSFQKPTGPVTVCLGTSSSFLFFRKKTRKCLYKARAGPARGPYEPHDPSIGGARTRDRTMLMRASYKHLRVSYPPTGKTS